MYVYKATNVVNGAAYIGATVNFARRQKEHKSVAKRFASRCAFHAAIRRYGFSAFTWEILAVVEDEDLLHLAEQEAIDLYKTRDTLGGYNHTDGGHGVFGLVFSDETRLKISKSSKGRACSQSTKEKLSDMRKGNPRPAHVIAAMHAAPWTQDRARKMHETKMANGSNIYIDDDLLIEMEVLRIAGFTHDAIALQMNFPKWFVFKHVRHIKKGGACV